MKLKSPTEWDRILCTKKTASGNVFPEQRQAAVVARRLDCMRDRVSARHCPVCKLWHLAHPIRPRRWGKFRPPGRGLRDQG